MPNFLQLPSAIPWWGILAISVPLALYGLLLLAMPFSVFGVKGRLDLLEGRLDDIHEEIRGLTVRLSESNVTRPETVYRDAGRPPIASQNEPDLPRFRPEPVEPRRQPATRPPRSEPRLDWPR